MPRIGLVLGAGGSTGHAFHVAVLSALETALGWDAREADVIVGTSAGAMVGALLRGGLSPRDLAARALGEPLSPEGERLAAVLGRPMPVPPAEPVGWSALSMASPELLLHAARRPWQARIGAVVAGALPAGRIATDHLVGGIGRLFTTAWPTRSLRIAAVRLDDGRRVVFGSNPATDPTVAAAVAASCAIPGYYRPVEIDGVRHVDGGAHSPTNADLLEDEGLDLVIVSSPMSGGFEMLRPGVDLPVRGLCRLLLDREAGRVRVRGTSVLTIEPSVADREVMGLNALDPRRRHAVIRQVRESTLARLDAPVLRQRLAPLRPAPEAPPVRAALGTSRVVELGVPVHFVDWGGDGPPMVLVHGLGGAHVNWMGVGPALARHGRVVALDLAGFGRTPTEGGSASIHANQALLDRFITRVVGEPAILVGNSMGGLVSMMVAAESPAQVAGLILVDAALPLQVGPLDAAVGALFAAYFVPGVGEAVQYGRKLLLGPDAWVKNLLALCCVDPSRIPPEIVEATIELSRERLHVPGGSAAFLQAARSLVAFILRRRAFEAMVRRIHAPTLILQGAHDRLVPLAAAEALAALRSDWPLHVFPDLGHVPQLEDPEAFVGAVTRWMDAGAARVGSRAS